MIVKSGLAEVMTFQSLAEIIEENKRLRAVVEAAKDVLADVEDWGLKKVPGAIQCLDEALAALEVDKHEIP